MGLAISGAMTYPVRWQEPENEYEVVARTIDQRYRLVPTEERNDLVRYWLAAAQTMYPGVVIYLMIVMANHLHGLLRDSTSQLSLFMQYFQCNLAKSLNQLDGRVGRVFEPRYSATPILTPDTMVKRFGYCVANPATANLVETYTDYPGVCLFSTTGLVELETSRLRQREYHDALRRSAMTEEDPEPEDFTDRRSLVITPYERAEAEEIEAAIFEAEAEAKRDRARKPVMGARKLRKLNPFARPKRPKRGRRPLCHAPSRAAWFAFRELRRAFVRAFKEASAAFRDGNLNVEFPDFSFRPSSAVRIPP